MSANWKVSHMRQMARVHENRAKKLRAVADLCDARLIGQNVGASEEDIYFAGSVLGLSSAWIKALMEEPTDAAAVRMAELKAGVDALKAQVNALKTEVDTLKIDVAMLTRPTEPYQGFNN